MTLRNFAINVVAGVWIVALVACAGDGASSEPNGQVTDVQATPRPGWIEVTWTHAGAATFEILRETLGASAIGGQALVSVGVVDGETRVFRDEDVALDATYRYAVAADGGVPVTAEGGAVAPEPGHLLQVAFASAVPAGAEFAVRSEPAGIVCAGAGGVACSAAFPSIADVALRVLAEGVSWTWEGCDGTAGGSCSIAMTGHRTVTVSLALANTLDVVVEPSAAGLVANVNDLAPNPSIACTSECSHAYPPGLAISLDAEPADTDHYRFVGWGGACEGDACTVTMDGDRRVEAQFALIPPEITSFTSSPDTVEPNESATLTWDVTGGGDVSSGELSIAIEPGVGQVSSRAGSVDVTPSSDTTYTLTVANASGTVQRSTTIAVDDRGPPPTIHYFVAGDDEIEEGDWTWLRWSVDGPGDVTVTIEPEVGSVSESGKIKVEPHEDTTYRLTASNQHGQTTAEVEVEVDDDDDDDDDDSAVPDADRAL